MKTFGLEFQCFLFVSETRQVRHLRYNKACLHIANS